MCSTYFKKASSISKKPSSIDGRLNSHDDAVVTSPLKGASRQRKLHCSKQCAVPRRLRSTEEAVQVSVKEWHCDQIKRIASDQEDYNMQFDLSDGPPAEGSSSTTSSPDRAHFPPENISARVDQVNDFSKCVPKTTLDEKQLLALGALPLKSPYQHYRNNDSLPCVKKTAEAVNANSKAFRPTSERSSQFMNVANGLDQQCQAISKLHAVDDLVALKQSDSNSSSRNAEGCCCGYSPMERSRSPKSKNTARRKDLAASSRREICHERSQVNDDGDDDDFYANDLRTLNRYGVLGRFNDWNVETSHYRLKQRRFAKSLDGTDSSRTASSLAERLAADISRPGVRNFGHESESTLTYRELQQLLNVRDGGLRVGHLSPLGTSRSKATRPTLSGLPTKPHSCPDGNRKESEQVGITSFPEALVSENSGQGSPCRRSLVEKKSKRSESFWSIIPQRIYSSASQWVLVGTSVYKRFIAS